MVRSALNRRVVYERDPVYLLLFLGQAENALVDRIVRQSAPLRCDNLCAVVAGQQAHGRAPEHAADAALAQ